jgi:exonuclease III
LENDGESEGTTNSANRESEVVSSEECVLTAGSKQMEGKPIVLLQVNCRNILNEILEFWILIDTYNPDVIISTELWLREEINNAEVFRDDYTTFRREGCAGEGGVCICVKNYIDSRVLWTDDDFEMIAVEVKGRDTKFTWEILGIYRAPNDSMRVMERLAARTVYTGHSTKRSIIGGDLNLPYLDWNGKAGCNNGTQASINSLV